jgi:hypothetical protein
MDIRPGEFSIDDNVVISKERRTIAGIWWTGSDGRRDDALTNACSDVC